MYIVKLPVGILGIIIAHNLILKAYHNNLMEILLHIELECLQQGLAQFIHACSVAKQRNHGEIEHAQIICIDSSGSTQYTFKFPLVNKAVHCTAQLLSVA